MKFTIGREALLKPLQIVSGVVEKRHTLPVLGNILMVLEGSKLTLTGTDLEVELRASTEVIDGTSGEITMPARKLLDICKSLSEGASISIDVSDGKALLRSGKSRFTLSTLPATEFPLTDSVVGVYEFSLPQDGLKRIIEQTQFCMANQDVRYYLNGLLIELSNGQLRAVATDGHRLALCETAADIDIGDKQQVIIPRKGVIELHRLLDQGDQPCQVVLSSNYARVSIGDYVFLSKLIDGRFPDYERVLPANSDKHVVADRIHLKDALARAAILSNEKYRGIRLLLSSGTLKATVNNPDQEEAEEVIEVDYQGDELEIGFNVAYLLDALNAIKEEEAMVELSDSNSSCLIHGVADTSSRYVVMPMRL